jgi:transposase InsO family protein
MKELRLKYPVPILRRMLGVSGSGFYAWMDRPLSKRGQEEARLELEIKAADKRTRQTYGPERLQRDLAAHGVKVGICRIKRIRKKLGIRCKQKSKFKVTTDSRHRLPVAGNLLAQKFVASRPNDVWLTDITYISTDEGWLYLAEGLLHHSDRGSQYCSLEYRRLLERFGLRASMSRKGNCYDNAPMESFWGTLKQELVNHRRYRTRQEAIREITEYIEIFYNRQRRQARLGFLSPAAYAQQFYAGLVAA